MEGLIWILKNSSVPSMFRQQYSINCAGTIPWNCRYIWITFSGPLRPLWRECGGVEVHDEEQHGSESAVITDHPCTHNERIERLWRDVTCSVGSIHYETFQNLEGSARFEPLNEIDIF